MNPRTIYGQRWWDEKRRIAYRKEDYHCWACGVHKSQALSRENILEAHESYNINYETGEVSLHEIIALCHNCHSFIHSYRTWILYQQGVIEYDDIYSYYFIGKDILERHGLKPFYVTEMYWLMLTQGKSQGDALDEVCKMGLYDLTQPFAPWEKWHLILENKKYYSLFQDEDAWEEHYKNLP